MSKATEATNAYYEYRYCLLRRKYRLRHNYQVSDEGLATFLFLEYRRLSPATWRFYRRAVLSVLQRDPDKNRFAIDLLEPLVNGPGQCRKFTKRANFPRNVPAQVACKLVHQLQSDWGSSIGARKYSAAAANALLATILTGLSPEDWISAEISMCAQPDGSMTKSLQIRARRSNQSATRESVTNVNLDAYSRDQLAVVTNTIAAFANNVDRVDEFLRSLNLELTRGLRSLARTGQIKPRHAHISLRSAASQFARERFSDTLPFGLAAKMRSPPDRRLLDH